VKDQRVGVLGLYGFNEVRNAPTDSVQKGFVSRAVFVAVHRRARRFVRLNFDEPKTTAHATLLSKGRQEQTGPITRRGKEPQQSGPNHRTFHHSYRAAERRWWPRCSLAVEINELLQTGTTARILQRALNWAEWAQNGAEWLEAHDTFCQTLCRTGGDQS
jgi:hypothetical protein